MYKNCANSLCWKTLCFFCSLHACLASLYLYMKLLNYSEIMAELPDSLFCLFVANLFIWIILKNENVSIRHPFITKSSNKPTLNKQPAKVFPQN